MTIFLSKIIIVLSIMTILLSNMIIFVYKLPLYLLKHFQIHNICFVFDIKNKHTFSMKFFGGPLGGPGEIWGGLGPPWPPRGAATA